MTKYAILVVALLINVGQSHAQTGGGNTYEFLNLVGSARVAALGGSLISVKDDDLNLGFYNPALLNKSMAEQLTLNYVNYFAGINYGHVSYAKHYDSIATFAGSLHYVNYGKFDQTTDWGETIGTFIPGEYALQLGAGRALDTAWSIGANAKLLYSSFEQYKSLGGALDFSVAYNNTRRLYSAGLLVKNVGMQFVGYNKGNREKVPFEIQAGLSKRLRHAPLRISVMLENLQRWNLRFVDPDPQPEVDPLTGDTIIDNKSHLGDILMRHVVLNAEILLTENFNVRVGYNYKRRQELKIADKPGLAGFSWGFAMKIKKFRLAYGRSIYSLAGGTNHITVSLRLSDFKDRAATSATPKISE